MNPVPPYMIARARAVHDALLINKCNILRTPSGDESTVDALGSNDEEYLAAVDVPCRYSPNPVGAAERLIAERMGEEYGGRVELPALLDVRLNDRLLVFDTEGLEIGMFNVRDISGRRSIEIGTQVTVSRNV